MRSLLKLARGIAGDLFATFRGSRNPWERSHFARLKSRSRGFFSERRDSLREMMTTRHRSIGFGASAVLLGLTLAASFFLVWRAVVATPQVTVAGAAPAAVRRPPRDEGLLALDYAFRYVAAGNLEQARAMVARLLELRPYDARTFQAQGMVRTAGGDFSGARESFRRSVELDPNDKSHRFNAGEIEFMDGQYAEAEKLFQVARSMNPEGEKVRFRLYLCAVMQGHEQDAASVLATIPTATNSPEWHYIMAAKAYREGHPEQALALIRAARLLFSKEVTDYEKTLARLGLFPE